MKVDLLIASGRCGQACLYARMPSSCSVYRASRPFRACLVCTPFVTHRQGWLRASATITSVLCLLLPCIGLRNLNGKLARCGPPPVTGNRCAAVVWFYRHASKTTHMCECVIVEQATDAETGNEYYWNSMTGETAWTLPTPVQTPAAISAASAVSTTVCVRHDAFMCVTRRCLLSTL